MKFRFDYEKNAKLKNERNMGFDEIIQAIEDGNLIDIIYNPNREKYPNQKVALVRMLEEVYAVPFVIEDDGTFFLKTLFPSRKARKKYLKNQAW
jgi:hypothetical protein